jgi:2-polyprenyl-6-methoxyphenol hydroxylase-like FAD-dependent oxidoreductase
MATQEHEVVIVGAGPTGLALGAELQRFGISPLILDRLAAGANTSRAAVIHARTLEVLEPLGIVPELIANGVIVPIFRMRERSRILATVDFSGLKTAYPFTLMCPQDRTERILLERLQALGGSVRRPCEVFAIQPNGSGVEIHYQSGDEPVILRTEWLVGCDGMHSIVREQAAIPFEGGEYEESFILADVQMDWPIERNEASLFLSEKGLVVVVPLPDNHFRIVATVENAPEMPTSADFESILKERGPEDGNVKINHLAWSTRFHIHHRVAKMLRKGRILLTGDAAHVHSPAGGQGMNTGIQDAVSLATALHRTLRNGDESALDTWQERRLSIARNVVKTTDQMTKLATLSSPAAKLLRNIAIEIMGHVPLAQHALAERLSELDNR